MAVRICRSVGWGFQSSRALALSNIPGVQKPQCTASWSRNDSCNGCSLPSCANPSTVTTSRPSICGARTRQEFTGSPSSRTVHAPHSPISQPHFVPSRPSWSRRRSSRVAEPRPSGNGLILIGTEGRMKITYTGRQVELAPAQLKKIETQFAKVGKLLDGREEKEAHVILSLERHLHQAEITVNYYNHQLVGIGSNVDLITAIHSAIEKLEKQTIKVRAKWRDTKRTPRKEEAAAPSEAAAEPEEPESERQVFRINHHERRKPMTLEEALLQMEKGADYLVYRDAETSRVAVLLRRRDGNFDLIEA